MDRKAWEVNGLRPYPWILWMKSPRKIRQNRKARLVRATCPVVAQRAKSEARRAKTEGFQILVIKQATWHS